MKCSTSDVMRFRLVLSIVLVVAPIVACQPKEGLSPGSKPVSSMTLEESDAGRIVEVIRGQEFIIRLASNRTTGYSWALVSPGAGIVSRPNEPSYIPESPAGMTGTGGVETWSFKAIQIGEEELKFEYRRPFEPDTPAAKAVSFTIRVR